MILTAGEIDQLITLRHARVVIQAMNETNALFFLFMYIILRSRINEISHDEISTTLHSVSMAPTAVQCSSDLSDRLRSVTWLTRPDSISKNAGPIRHCEPPHAHSPGVAVARRLRIDVHDDNANDNDNNNDNA